MNAAPDALAVALLQLAAAEPGLSLARAGKRLGAGQSQLRRLLAGLGEDPALGGLGLLRVVEEERRTRLWPSAAGLALLQQAAAVPPVPAELPAGLRATRALRIEHDQGTPFVDRVAAEVPVALLYNGRPHVVMLATPADLEDFALGFSLSEGIVEQAAELRLLDRTESAAGIALHLHVPQARADALELQRRNLAGRSGCGLCGAETLAAALRPVRLLPPGASVPGLQRLRTALARLPALQPLHQASGALHAAALLHAGGLLVREDIGRHNALDKAIGAAARAGLVVEAALLSSRASYELVHKSAQAGIPLLAALSGPTHLAIELARQAGMVLLGHMRGARLTQYSGAPLVGAGETG